MGPVASVLLDGGIPDLTLVKNGFLDMAQAEIEGYHEHCLRDWRRSDSKPLSDRETKEPDRHKKFVLAQPRITDHHAVPGHGIRQILFFGDITTLLLVF